MSISQENKDVNDIINEWTKTGGRDASNKACKAIREYYKQEQLKKQIIQQGGAGNATEQFIQQAEHDNGFYTRVDNLMELYARGDENHAGPAGQWVFGYPVEF